MPDPLLEDDDQYASEDDSDFAPEDAAGRDSEASDAEEGDEGGKDSAKRKRPADGREAEDAGFQNSGDEAVITKAKKRRKKTQGQDAGPANEDEGDEGGEGGLVKTRSMRAAEKAERRATVNSGPVTIDVDALWAQMVAGTPPAQPIEKEAETSADAVEKSDAIATDEKKEMQQQVEVAPRADSSDMIRIKRKYNFAGQVHTEEKLVPRESAEAKLYLASREVDAAEDDDEPAQPKRVLKKAFRSAFEPVVATGPQRADLNLGVTVRMQAREAAKEAGAKKLNTVEKSKMDWAGFVDKEGLKDELELAGKSKDSFAERQQFLARSEARREEDARRVRLAARV